MREEQSTGCLAGQEGCAVSKEVDTNSPERAFALRCKALRLCRCCKPLPAVGDILTSTQCVINKKVQHVQSHQLSCLHCCLVQVQQQYRSLPCKRRAKMARQSMEAGSLQHILRLKVQDPFPSAPSARVWSLLSIPTHATRSGNLSSSDRIFSFSFSRLYGKHDLNEQFCSVRKKIPFRSSRPKSEPTQVLANYCKCDIGQCDNIPKKILTNAVVCRRCEQWIFTKEVKNEVKPLPPAAHPTIVIAIEIATNLPEEFCKREQETRPANMIANLHPINFQSSQLCVARPQL